MRILKFIALSVLVALIQIRILYASTGQGEQQLLTHLGLSEQVELYTEDPGSDENPSSVFVKVPVPPINIFHEWGAIDLLKVRLPGGGSNIREWETAFTQIQRVLATHALKAPVIKTAWITGIVIPMAFRNDLNKFVCTMFKRKEHNIYFSDLSGITCRGNVFIFQSALSKDHLPRLIAYSPHNMLVVFDLPGNDDLFYPEFNAVIKSVGQPSMGLVSSNDSKSSSHTNIEGSDHHKIETGALVDFIPPLSASKSDVSEGAVNHKLQDPAPSSHANVGDAVNHELQDLAPSSRTNIEGPVSHELQETATSSHANIGGEPPLNFYQRARRYLGI